MSGPLLDVAALAKPAIVLIEKISDAIGAFAKPWQIVRIARAQATVEEIASQSRIDISDLEARAVARLVYEEGRRQDNIERIAEGALPKLLGNARPQDIEADWLIYLFDRCRLTSDSDMQNLWSNILAGETNSPGSFSRRTIDLVSTMDKFDADLFVNISTFVWDIVRPQPLVMDPEIAIYKDSGLNFDALTHLVNIGLITYTPGVFGLGYEERFDSKMIEIRYGNKRFQVTLFEDDGKFKLKVGKVLFTKAGQELYKICQPTRNDEFIDFIVEMLTANNCEVQQL